MKINDFKIESPNKQFKLNIAKTIAHLYESDQVVDYLKSGYLKLAIWSTERSDDNKSIKYIGQPFWSKKALLHFKNNGIKGLRHEHIIPNKIVLKVLNNSKKDFTSVFEVLDKILHSVVVTKEEAHELDKMFKDNIPQNIKLELRNDVDLLFSRYIRYNEVCLSDKIEMYYLNEEQRKSAKTIMAIELDSVKRII